MDRACRAAAVGAAFLIAASMASAETIPIPVHSDAPGAAVPASAADVGGMAAATGTNTSPAAPAPPAARQRPGLFTAVNTKRKVVALTFDDGPHGQLTPKLLDLLKRENVRATFFVLGSLVEANPAIVQRMAAEGHEVANHTWNHPRLPSLSAEKFAHQIRDTTEIIEKNTGKKVTLTRPTYGLYNERVKNELLDSYGLDIILWSVDPNDWKRPGANVVARRLVEGAHPGAILLAHDIHPGTIAAMPQTITQLKAKGYEFATVSDLLAMDEAPTPSPAPSPTPATVPPDKEPGSEAPVVREISRE
jgi:peptidoglycan-N-acetylglucosamine deacetylase